MRGKNKNQLIRSFNQVLQGRINFKIEDKWKQWKSHKWPYHYPVTVNNGA